MDPIDPASTHEKGTDTNTAERKSLEHRYLSDIIEPVDSPSDNPASFYPDGGRRAWLTLSGCFCSFFAALAMMNSLGVFQAWLLSHELKDEGPSRVGWIFGFYTFFSFFSGIQIGPWFDASGPRKLSLIGSIFLTLMYCLIGLCHRYWHFFLVIGVIGGSATSLLFTAAIGTVQHWFFARRGLATGLALSGGSLGGIVFPLVLEKLLPRIGLAWTTRAMALMLLPFTVTGILFMKARFSSKPKGRFVFPDLSVLWTTKIATMTVAIFFMELGLFIPLAYITSFALKQGIDASISYHLLTFLNVGSLLGRWIPGYLADKLGRFNTQNLAIFSCLLSILALWLPAGNTVGVVVAFAVVFGFGSGSNISLTPVCLGQLCETENYGRTYGAVYTVSSFGALTGIPLAGQILSATDGEYWSLIMFAGIAYGISLILFVAVQIMEIYKVE